MPLATILPEFVMGPVRTAEAASTSLSAGFLKVGGGMQVGRQMHEEARCPSVFVSEERAALSCAHSRERALEDLGHPPSWPATHTWHTSRPRPPCPAH